MLVQEVVHIDCGLGGDTALQGRDYSGMGEQVQVDLNGCQMFMQNIGYLSYRTFCPAKYRILELSCLHHMDMEAMVLEKVVHIDCMWRCCWRRWSWR